ncbi:MAG: hypothetical protein QW356_02045 [Candidatus Hadarchaeales archaeon]
MEIVCRLDDLELKIRTDSYPSELLSYLLRKSTPIRRVECVENMGGNWEYVERMVSFHRYYAEGKITGRQLTEICEIVWGGRIPDTLVVDGKVYIEPALEEIYRLLTKNPKEISYEFRDKRRKAMMEIFEVYRGKPELRAKLLEFLL